MSESMSSLAPQITRLDTDLSLLGMVRLGAFHPLPGENVVPGQAEQPGTIVLVGNAGSAMWSVFDKAKDRSDKDAMNSWTTDVLTPIASWLGCQLVFPFGGPPWYPFVSWAERCPGISKSPLGMGVHHHYGLFHAHRGAFFFNDRLTVHEDTSDNPCSICRDRPCLSACPVSAFSHADTVGSSYDYAACKDHVRTGDRACWQGCLARKACPVGRDYHYASDHAAFHMRAFVGPARD